MEKLSAIIITFNEEQNIAATLDAAWKVADEIIVVDSGSTDKTKDICIEKGATFITQKWLGFGRQRNFAVTQAANDYILVLDADEVLDDRLIKSILQIKKEGYTEQIYLLRRLNFYYGKCIRYGMENPDIKARLYDKSFAKWNDKLVHEDLEYRATLKAVKLKGYLLHYTNKTISEHIIKADRYSNLASLDYFERRKRNPGIIKLVINPAFTFIKAYFLKAGFLDGWYGLILAKLHAGISFQKYAKLKILYYQDSLAKNSAQKEMQNVCFVNSMNFWGGGEKLHFEYATAFKEKNYNIHLLSKKGSPLFKKSQSNGLAVASISVKDLSFLNPFKYIQLVRFFKKEKIDTVIFSGSNDMKLGGFAAKLAKVKNIVYLRGLAVPIKDNFINRLLFRKVLTHIVANSEETKRTILQNLGKYITDDKIEVIYHGIDVGSVDTKGDQKLSAVMSQAKGIILGNAGRLTLQKGQQHLIEIARKLKEKNIEFTLFIAGTGELEAQLRTMINKYDLQKEVILLGFVEDVESFMNSIDIFLLTSTWEGFGYVIVEAMAKSKPVIAFDITSNPEIVNKDNTGYLVKYPDTNAFAMEVEKLANDKNLREQLGKNGRKYLMDNFQLKDRIDEFEDYLLSTPA
jgi:glycosyltransferase involved in cell wall biosynthesis